MKKVTLIFSILLTGAIGSSCSQSETRTSKNPAGYDLDNPVRYPMNDDLMEISGIAFNNGDNKVVYAHQDETGDIFYFRPGNKNVSHVSFGKSGDYEDIAIGNNMAVMLRSNGQLSSFPLREVTAGQIRSVKRSDSLLPAGEYEGLYYDRFTNKLYALCKQRAGGKKDKICNGYILNLAADGSISKSGEFSIDVNKIIGPSGKKKLNFRPSALAKNPLTRQWYILSSINKLLVVTDENFNVQQSYPLNRKFLQPEGMAFDSQGNLYISNEGDELSAGNILMFRYTKAVK